MIPAEATTINMTKVPQLPVEEDAIVEYVCETGYAEKHPDVQWFLDDVACGVPDVQTEADYSSPGEIRWMTKSTLRLTIERNMNNKKVKCVLMNDHTILNEHNLNVICKFMPLHVCERLEFKVSHFCKIFYQA